MTIRERQIARIRAYLEDSGTTRRQLSIKAGVHHSTVTYVLDRPGWDCKASTIEKLAAAIPADFQVNPHCRIGRVRMKSQHPELAHG